MLKNFHSLGDVLDHEDQIPPYLLPGLGRAIRRAWRYIDSEEEDSSEEESDEEIMEESSNFEKGETMETEEDCCYEADSETEHSEESEEECYPGTPSTGDETSSEDDQFDLKEMYDRGKVPKELDFPGALWRGPNLVVIENNGLKRLGAVKRKLKEIEREGLSDSELNYQEEKKFLIESKHALIKKSLQLVKLRAEKFGEKPPLMNIDIDSEQEFIPATPPEMVEMEKVSTSIVRDEKLFATSRFMFARPDTEDEKDPALKTLENAGMNLFSALKVAHDQPSPMANSKSIEFHSNSAKPASKKSSKSKKKGSKGSSNNNNNNSKNAKNEEPPRPSFSELNLPILFDPEMSGREIPRSLPPANLEHAILLTVKLEALGVIAAADQKANAKHSAQKLEFDLTYAFLITWLLQLVPKYHDFAEGEPVSPLQDEVPFNVLGFDVRGRGGDLYLNISVVVKKEKEPEQRQKKGKNKQQSYFNELSNTVKKYLNAVTIMEVVSSVWQSEEGATLHKLTNLTDVTWSEKKLGNFIQVSTDSNAITRIFGNSQYDLEFGLVGEPPVNISQINNTSAIPLENAFGLIHGGAFAYGWPIMEMFLRIQAECMDISALRLVWIVKSEYNAVTLSQTYTDENLERNNAFVPALAIGVRGFNACQMWQDICGPRNVKVAQFTDSNSLSANHGDYLFQKLYLSQASLHQLKEIRSESEMLMSQVSDTCLFYAPRSPNRSHEQYSLFFGGEVHIYSLKKNKLTVESIRAECRDHFCSYHDPSSIVFFVSHRLPLRYLGDFTRNLQNYGCSIQAIRRVSASASSNLSSLFGEGFEKVIGQEVGGFCVIAKRENAGLHWVGIMNRLKEEILGFLLRDKPDMIDDVLQHTIYCQPLTAEMVRPLRDLMCSNPKIEPLSWKPVGWYKTLSESCEQTTCLIISGPHAPASVAITLYEIFSGENGSSDYQHCDELSSLPNGGFELVAIRQIYQVTEYQARELVNVDYSDKNYEESINELYENPLVVLVLRRIDAIKRVDEYVQSVFLKRKIKMTFTDSASWTRRAINCLFFPHELEEDNSCRGHLRFWPESKEKIPESLFSQSVPTQVVPFLLNPMAHSCFSQVLLSLLQNVENCELVSLRLFPQMDENQGDLIARQFEAPERFQNSQVMRRMYGNVKRNCADIWMNGSSVLFVVRGADIFRRLTNWAGLADPEEARISCPGSIRARYGVDRLNNAVHLPRDMEESEALLSGLCPAGAEEETTDYDISIECGSLADLEDSIQENIVLVFELERAGELIDQFNRSNFRIIGLRTVRFTRNTAKKIFRTNAVAKAVANKPVLCAVVWRSSNCVETLKALDKGFIYQSASYEEAAEQIPKIFAELLIS